MTNTTSGVIPGVYGNLRHPQRTGILGLSLGVSLAGVPFILVSIVLMATGRAAAAGVVIGVGVLGAVLLVATKRQGRSIYGRKMLKIAQRRKEKSGKHLYISGPTGFTPDGATRLPGLMADTELTEHLDSSNQPFGLLRTSGRGAYNYSVVIEARPDGDALVDGDSVNRQVAHWGGWLQARGQEDGVRGASVTIESAPDSGLRLRRLLSHNRADGGPEFARIVTDGIANGYDHGAPEMTVRLTVTFDGKAFEANKDRGREEMAIDIGDRLPGILGGLHSTGAGVVRACTAQEIIDFTRVAYDPTTASAVEEAQMDGGTNLRWADAGPSYAADLFDYYKHDRVFSSSWTLYEEPRGTFTHDSLRRLLEPMPGVLRKRVTLLYRPVPIDRTTDLVQREIKEATFGGSQQRVSVRAVQRQKAALKSAQEETMGAGVARFGTIVTVSVTDPEQFRRLDKEVPALFSRTRLRVRKALANQAVTFQAGLPLGVVLPDHMLLNDEIQDFFS
ncbi:SCO6880 family protein [Nesterenkonia sandarakina]|uniref:Type VII secretion protein EccE n=1 Tax=Nesterenkonia sandarakina TaxID=272918 RepID=A0A7Z0J4L3_9MICC|nr:SCO6880 family protein [Nesterenkonia sandarakina]NYJ18201.1 hypothetical protein [Nesterenkonia sandarakina]